MAFSVWFHPWTTQRRVIDMVFNTFISLPNMPRKHCFCLAQLWTQRRSEQQTRLCNYSPNIQLPHSFSLSCPGTVHPKYFTPHWKMSVFGHWHSMRTECLNMPEISVSFWPSPTSHAPPPFISLLFAIPSSNNHVAYYTDEQGVQIEWQRERKRLFFSGLTLFTASRVKSSRVEGKESENIALCLCVDVRTFELKN